MDDSEGGPQPSGLLPDQAASYAASFAKSLSVDNDRWAKAEQRTALIIDKIQPTRASEERRKAVADFVRDLIRKCFPCNFCRVFTFGSVPLLTYLPDGDIDLTIVSQDPGLKDTWANAVRTTLERAERNQDAEFRVREVLYIHAEVKLIKCLVENIVVDISFNQLGGLCTLCFLDEVDLVIGQSHLFKRSIILVKAWCYYESATLGAHHGLLSTYALETLVLYIFNVFHNSIRGPLEVLLRFLEYFSKFDWNSYCVSLWGPVPLASLPEMAAEAPCKGGGDLLLSREFLRACGEAYAVFPAGQDTQGRTFTPKYLNVVDPLRPGNNLGRSVNQTNFNRIIRVFGHSAEKLLKFLHDSSKDIVQLLEDKQKGFFKRTKERLHKLKEKRPDAPEFIARQISTSAGSHHQNGSIGGKGQEGGEMMRSYGAQTYYVDQRNGIVQMIGSQRPNFTSSPTSNGGGNFGYVKGTSHESRSDSGSNVAPGSNGNSSIFESGHLLVNGVGKGIQSNNEATEKPKGHSRKTSMESLNVGISDNVVNGSRQKGAARELANSDTHSSEQRDTKAAKEECSSKGMTSVNGGTKKMGSNFGNHVVPTGSTEATNSESSQGNTHFAMEASSEGPVSARSSSSSNSEKELSRRVGWAGEQQSYGDAGGGLDGQGQTQQRGQDPNSRGGHIPLAVQAPSMTLPHPGQFSMHLATSVPLSSTMGHPSMTLTSPPPPPPLGRHSGHPSSVLGDSSPGLGPCAGMYYGLQLLRPSPPVPPPIPPLPRGHFHSPSFAQSLLAVADNSNTGTNRMPAFPVRQGEEKAFDQQHREVWQQMDQMHVQDHHHQYFVHGAVSSHNGSLSPQPQPQHSDSEPSSIVSAAPAVVPSSPFYKHGGTVIPRVPSGVPGVKTGNGTNLEVLSETPAGHELSEDVIEETGKPGQEDGELGIAASTRGKSSHTGSEGGGKGNKNSKSSKEKRAGTKVKSTGYEDAMEVGKLIDGVPASNSESTLRWPTQGISDDAVSAMQGYPVPPPGSVVYPNVIPSFPPPPANGTTVADLCSYGPPLLPSHRTSVALSTLPSPTQSQSSPMATIYSVNTRSYQSPVTELVGGSIAPSSNQLQRPMENTSLHRNSFYPGGHPFSLPSVYTPYPIYYRGGLMGMDLSGCHFSGFMENFSDPNAGQAAEGLHLKQGGLGVGEKLRALGIPIRAGSRLEGSIVDGRGGDAGDAMDSGFDLLSGDFRDHLQNLDIARSCQRVQVQPHPQPQFMMTPAAKYFPSRAWEGPGRPMTTNVNLTPNIMSHGHGLVQGPQSVNTSGRVVGNYHRPFSGPVSYGGDEPPKSHVGTGTYLPMRVGSSRDRQSSGSSRNQHGGCGQDRNERSDREGHQAHAPRYRGMGRGQSKYEPRSQNNNTGGVDRNNVDGKGSGERGRDGHRQQDSFRRNPVQSVPSASHASPSPGMSAATVVSPASGGMPVGMHSTQATMGNGKSSTHGTTGTAIPHVVMASSNENRTGFVSEPLEFGSFGSVQAGTTQEGNEVDHGAAHVSTLQSQELLHDPNPPGSAGSSLASCDISSQRQSSPKQRVMRRIYQLKEEDFPPLSFRGQQGSSSTGSNNDHSDSSQVPPTQHTLVRHLFED